MVVVGCPPEDARRNVKFSDADNRDKEGTLCLERDP